LYRTLLSGRQVLVVLDNARDAEQVRPLLPGSAGCFVVVTSRNRLTGLVAAEGASPLTLDVLAADEARELLRSRLGDRTRLAAEPEAVEEIIRSCGRLPLALTVIAARAVTRPESSLATLAAQLRDARGLDAYDTDGDPTTDVRSVISWSYRSLTVPAARMFRLLGLHPGPDIAEPAAASLAGIPAAHARRLLAELLAANMVSEPESGRFAMHDLPRAYAAELARETDSPAARRSATRRMLDHYLGSAHTADQLLSPQWSPIALPAPSEGVVPESFATEADAFAWFAAERAVLLAAVRYAATEGFQAHAWRLAWALTDFLDRHGDWHEWAETQRIGLAAAVQLDDPQGEAHAHRGMAGALARLGRYPEARSHLQDALVVFDRLGDCLNLGRTRLNLGWVCEEQGAHVEALQHVSEALELLRAAGNPQGEASTLNALAWLHTQLGQDELALRAAEPALALFRHLGDRHGEAGCLDTAGVAHDHLGHHADAVACFEASLALRRRIGGRYYEANILAHLGDSYRALGDAAAAHEAWRQSLHILDEIDHPDADLVRGRIEGAGR
jgi:tetratricopeptide (TPR) repeat protein